jgi:GNAT superfamily N-acetyltransferase
MIHYETSNRLADAVLAKSMLDGLEHYYPDFGFWYVNKCMPGILTGNDLLLVAREHERIIGVALGKKDEHETKLRCVRVLPEYQNRGIGLHLVERTLRALDDDKPHCTVAEELFHQYSRAFINLFQFDLSEVDKGRYRKNKLEYVFNAPPNGMGKLIAPL